MSRRGVLLEQIELKGLELAPPQVWKGVKLVPLLRRALHEDLRLAKRRFREDATVVSLDGGLLDAGVKYVSFVPHGLVMSWSNDGTAAATLGAQLGGQDGKRFDDGVMAVRVAHRMVRREGARQLRFLPLHVAMEGFLSMYFGGPEVAWTEYSQRAISRGLDPREETAYSGRAVLGLDDALRVFEIHERQVGVLVFVAEALASAFVVPHPADYVDLHQTLIEDFYGELIVEYAMHARAAHEGMSLDESKVSSVVELRRELGRMRAAWAASQAPLAAGLLGRDVHGERVYRAGPFQLQRFVSDLDPGKENHIGEAIVREDGELEYLKTFRLSAAQTRRAFLLKQLAEQHWNLEATAAALRQSKDELVRRLEKAGFDYLLKEHVLAAARRRK